MGQQDANHKIRAFLFPEPLTAIGEGIAWQLGYPSYLSDLEDPL